MSWDKNDNTENRIYKSLAENYFGCWLPHLHRDPYAHSAIYLGMNVATCIFYWLYGFGI